ATIWSDRRKPELLGLIIEQQIPQSLHRLLAGQTPATAESTAVGVQVLQTFSIMLDGITDTKFLYALFSNNFVNDLIAAPVDMDNEEVLPYYVAFLKALSLKLTPDTIHFFFNQQQQQQQQDASFPLYTTAIGLFDHPDSMVRVAVRAITLNVFRINDKEALEYILDAPKCAHFWEHIMLALRGACDDAFRILVDMPEDSACAAKQWAAVDVILENHMGLLAYVNDILGLGVERINRRVAAEFADRILARTYVHAVEVGWRAEASSEETLFMQVATLCMAHFFAIVKYSPLLIDTANALFAHAPPAHDDAADPATGEASDSAASSVQAPRVSSLHDDYAGDDPRPALHAVHPVTEAATRLAHPFVLSPFESSRTLTPWLCVALELLGNKAVSPTTLARSVLAPRRMLRTRALLESLTGSPANMPDCRSFSSGASALTVTLQPLAQPGAQPSPQLLPPYTQAIATAMVQVLADAPSAHGWITVDLAALLLVQLTRTSRGGVQLDAGLSDELEQAYATHTAELRATLVSPDEQHPAVARGSWKVLVQCLVDLANSTAETLLRKIEAEGRLIFHAQAPVSSAAESSSASGSAGSVGSDDAALAAAVHQAYHLRRLRTSSAPTPARGLYAAALRAWLGSPASAPSTSSQHPATVVDNSVKHQLPKSVPRLGFAAHVGCHQGCLYIVQQHSAEAKDATSVELVWPLADVEITRSVEEAPSTLHVLRIRDTVFPSLFYPPRPQSLGGINVAAAAGTANRARVMSFGRTAVPQHTAVQQPQKKLNFAYFSSQKALDISLRFVSPDACATCQSDIEENIRESRTRLASIFTDFNVI
ncbi:hypothetical protein IW150_004680, partial [Coemansia sp. RSA 2607]